MWPYAHEKWIKEDVFKVATFRGKIHIIIKQQVQLSFDQQNKVHEEKTQHDEEIYDERKRSY